MWVKLRTDPEAGIKGACLLYFIALVVLVIFVVIGDMLVRK